MIKLTKNEKDEILKLSTRFVEIHQEILQVEKTIKKMQEKAESLIEDLEECRESEKIFTKKLHSKYGEGHLDPVNLEWKKEEIIYEIQK